MRGPHRCQQLTRADVTSAVHYLRFELDPAQIETLAAGPVGLALDHPAYGECVELWFDGAWDKDHPTRDWPHDPAWEPLDGARWEWARLYEHIHRLQPECLVIQNSSSDRPGVPNYLPVDARTAEQFDFVWRERVCEARVDPVFPSANGPVYLPLEYCTTLTPGWFWQKDACYSHASAETIAGWRLRAERQQANLLLNIGPDTSGRMPELHRPFLVEAERLVRAARP